MKKMKFHTLLNWTGFLAIQFLVFGLPGRAQEVVTTPTGSRLAVTVKPEKNKILPGEPIEVAVEYRYLKPDGWTPERKWTQDVWAILQTPITITAYAENGNPVAQGISEGKNWFDSDYDLDSETITRYFFLPRWFSLTQPGFFRLAVETQFTTHPKSTFPLEPARAIHFPISAVGTIEVLSPDDKLMGEVIRKIGQKAVATDFNPYLKYLYRIEDPRVVPFLKQKLGRWIRRSKSYEPTSDFPIRRKQGEGIQIAFPLPLQLIGFQRDPIDKELECVVQKLASFNTKEAMSALVEVSTCKNDDTRKSATPK